MRVLVACEKSGVVRDAFIRKGHDAISADILPSDSPGPHYQGDVLALMSERWDLVIAHPPCTYLSNSGVRWLHSDPDRWAQMRDGAEFFRRMFEFDTPRLCVENPVQHRYAVAAHGHGRQTQVIQPWQYGHTESKATCLWLRGLPELLPTNNVRDEMLQLPISQRHRLHYLPPGEGRAAERSKTFSGVAEAMVLQWGIL